MRLYLILPTLLAVFCVCPCADAQSQSSVNCPKINVKAEITHTREGKSNGEVVLKFPEGVKAGEFHILLHCLGCVEPKKADGSDFKDLQPGYYDIYVIDKKGCSAQLNIQVK